MRKFGVKVISLLTLAALLVCTLASCGVKEIVDGVIDSVSSLGHKHNFTIDNHDGYTHWRECECGERSDEGAHIGSSATCREKAICEVCGAAWGEHGAHEYTEPEYTAYEHWYKCACGEVALRGSHELDNGVCDCGYVMPEVHTHKYDTLRYDAESHWYRCSCGGIESKAEHYGGTASCTEQAQCELCFMKYGVPIPHTPSTVTKTDTHHSYICSCGEVILTEPHGFFERVCSCGYTLPPEEHVHSFTVDIHDSTSHWKECACGVADIDTIAPHFGGSADCTTLAVCEGCGESYGDVMHVWNSGELVSEADSATPAMIAYTCTKCDQGKVEAVGSDMVVVTRAELEEAIVAAAWAFYMKKDQLQYDSQQITAVSAAYAGTVRHTQEVSPEHGSSDTNIYLVCSAYVYECYLEAIGRRIFENKYHPNGVLTTMLWICADNQMPDGFNDLPASTPQPRDDSDLDMAIARWIDTDTYDDFLAESSFATRIEAYDVDGSSAFYDWYEDGKLELVKTDSGYQYYLDGVAVSSADVKTKLIKWITKKVDGEYVNLRPGDIIIQEGHTLIHIGNGRILDCGGSKYNTSVGVDKVEASGAVYSRFNTINGTISKPGSFWAIIRPLDYYAYDVDGILGNDIMAFDGEAITVKESSKSRIEYPAMDIDRTVDITPYGTAAKGETLTYTIKITNNTNETNYLKWKNKSGYTGETYESLAVSESIPTGTVFHSASDGYALEGDRLYWTVDIPAGESVTLSYTVTVTAEVGEVITSDGGYVASIPSNSISNRVGGAKLTGEQMAKLREIASGGSEALTGYGTDLAFAEDIFAEIDIELNLTNVSELVENLFSVEYFERMESMSCFYTHKTTPITMLTPDGEVSPEYAKIASMLVDGYYGGYRVFDHDAARLTELGVEGFDYTEMNGTIIEFRADYLEVGDILVYAQSTNRATTELSSEMAKVWVMVYAGDGVLLEMGPNGAAKVYTGTATDARLVEAYKNTYDIFFLLRPTQAQ